jgi:hypothetical protein
MAVTVEPPLSLTEQVADFWNKLGNPISFFMELLQEFQIANLPDCKFGLPISGAKK